MVRRLALLVAAALPAPGIEAAELPRTAGWVEVRSTHFTLYSSAGAADTKKIAIELERFREALGRMSKGFELPDKMPTVLYVFRNDNQFTPYKLNVDGRTANVSGYFVEGPFRSYVALDASADWGMRVPYHEYLHAVLHRTFAQVPVWLDEGLAEFYSTFRFRALSNDAEIGYPIEEHLEDLAGWGMMSLPELLTSEAPAHDFAGSQGRFYAQAWLLVHLLVTDETRRSAVNRLLGLLKAGTDPDEAVAQTLGPDLYALQALLPQYLENLRRYVRRGGGAFKLPFDDPIEKQAVAVRDMAPGDVLYRLGDLLANLGAPTAAAARAHLEAALAQGGPVAEIRTALGAAAAASGDAAEAERRYRQATETEGADAEAYARRGILLLHRFLETKPRLDGTSEPPGPVLEARALLQRSVELDPDGVEALAALGTTYLFGAAGAEEGLQALGQANALRPDRVDVLADLACMLAKSGRADAAWSVIKNRLARRAGDPALADQAERCVAMRQSDSANERLARGDRAGAIEILTKLERRVTVPELRGEVESYRSRIEGPNPAPPGIGSLTPAQASAIVQQHNQAVGLVKEGKHEDALATLEHSIEGCNESELCEKVRSTADSLRRMVEHNRIVRNLNEAVDLLNEGKDAQAIERLRALEQRSTIPELTEKIRAMLEELGAR